MKRIVGGVAIVLSLALVGPAAAQPLNGESITTVLYLPSFPAGPPFVANYSGTFAASGSIAESGTVSAQAVFGAVPSPSAAVLQTTRTLTSTGGTLTLRCTQIATSLSDLSAVPNTGTCAVLDATGVYAELAGSGKLTGVADLTAVPVTVTDTLVF